MKLKKGQILNIKTGKYVVINMVEYKEDTWIWQEYEIKEVNSYKHKWLSVEKDENNKEIITTSPINIPYKQGYSTRIIGNFLTKRKPGGIEINTEFDDEINIDIDNILTY